MLSQCQAVVLPRRHAAQPSTKARQRTRLSTCAFKLLNDTTITLALPAHQIKTMSDDLEGGNEYVPQYARIRADLEKKAAAGKRDAQQRLARNARERKKRAQLRVQAEKGDAKGIKYVEQRRRQYERYKEKQARLQVLKSDDAPFDAAPSRKNARSSKQPQEMGSCRSSSKDERSHGFDNESDDCEPGKTDFSASDSKSTSPVFERASSGFCSVHSSQGARLPLPQASDLESSASTSTAMNLEHEDQQQATPAFIQKPTVNTNADGPEKYVVEVSNNDETPTPKNAGAVRGSEGANNAAKRKQAIEIKLRQVRAERRAAQLDREEAELQMQLLECE